MTTTASNRCWGRRQEGRRGQNGAPQPPTADIGRCVVAAERGRKRRRGGPVGRRRRLKEVGVEWCGTGTERRPPRLEEAVAMPAWGGGGGGQRGGAWISGGDSVLPWVTPPHLLPAPSPPPFALDRACTANLLSLTSLLSPSPRSFRIPPMCACEEVGQWWFWWLPKEWGMHDKTYTEELEISNLDNGYVDIIAKVDIPTYRRIPWEDDIPFFLLSFYDPATKEPLYMCPRGLLKNILNKYEMIGLKPVCGAEFEFFNFKETPETMAEKQYNSPIPLTQGMFGYSLLRPTSNQDYFYEIFDELKKFRVNLEGLHTETGPGVYEAALEYSPAMNMADSATLFKLGTKQIGLLRYGVMSSFMAKPHDGLPGCSGHLHFSLEDINKKNAFAKENGDVESKDEFMENGTNNEKEWRDTKAMSDTMKYFLAGVLEGLPSIMPLLAPTVNSYKRLVENYWAPVNVSWGLENRTAAIRIISPPTSSVSATRIEMRVSGADINPYFAISATLACGLYGIENNLPIKIPPLSPGEKMNLTQHQDKRLAKSLQEATLAMMKKDSIARKVLGDRFVDHFGKTRLHEWTLWETNVTNWEIKRYFETV